MQKSFPGAESDLSVPGGWGGGGGGSHSDVGEELLVKSKSSKNIYYFHSDILGIFKHNPTATG